MFQGAKNNLPTINSQFKEESSTMASVPYPIEQI